MKKLQIAASAVVLSAALVPALAVAQNIALVNGKAVPKARMDMMIEQATKQGNQPRTPEMERQVKDALVMRRSLPRRPNGAACSAAPTTARRWTSPARAS